MNNNQPSPEEVLDQLHKLIVHYNNNRLQLTDEEQENMRGLLSTASYLVVETSLQPAYMDMVATEVALERADGEVFMEYFNEFRKTKGDTAAETLARKSMKMDQRYLDALEQHGKAKQYAYLLNRLLDQANQVMNSMAKKSRY